MFFYIMSREKLIVALFIIFLYSVSLVKSLAFFLFNLLQSFYIVFL